MEYAEILNFNMTIDFFQNFIIMRYYINGEFADMNVVTMTSYQVILGSFMYIWVEGGKTPLMLKLDNVEGEGVIAMFYMDLESREVKSLPVFNQVTDPLILMLNQPAMVYPDDNGIRIAPQEGDYDYLYLLEDNIMPEEEFISPENNAIDLLPSDDYEYIMPDNSFEYVF